MHSEARGLLENHTVVDNPDPFSYDLQVVVDAPSRQRIAPLEPTANEKPLIVIDHHQPADLQDYAISSYIDCEAPATAILVYKILQNGEWTIPEPAAMTLAAGTLDDTGFRAIVMPDVQDDLIALLDQAGDYGDQLSTLWETETTRSERVATARALVRSRGYKSGGTILLISEIGGQEAAAAHALLDGNGDIAVIISERESETRVVARTSERLGDTLSLPDDVLQPLAAEFGGYAGGHAGAGVAKLEPTSPSAIEEQVVQYVEKALGQEFGRLS